jgi:3-deoxy-D-manno-octulosonic-acid transferase
MYSLLYYLTLPVIILHTLKKDRASLKQKLGFYHYQGSALTENLTKVVHIHCVSVGEFNGAKILIDKLLKENYQVLITNTTKTGFMACEKYYQNKVTHAYFPLDFHFAIQRFLRVFQPKISMMFETEIWPNYAKICHKKGIKLGIINARLSQKSFDKYYRYPNFSKKVLSYFDFIATQNEKTTEYFQKLGGENIHTLPSIKFELNINLKQEVIEKIKTITKNRKFVICASTHADEEEQIIKAYLKNPIKQLLVIMPRHPQRFLEVEKMLIKYKINYQKQSFLSRLNLDNKKCDVLLADSMGELLEYYSLCDVAFVGGSLVNGLGGHNILEPIAFDKLTITGKNIFNFQTIIDNLKQNQAMLEITTADELMQITNNYLQNPENYQQIIQNAKQVFDKNQGASDELLKIITHNLSA